MTTRGIEASLRMTEVHWSDSIPLSQDRRVAADGVYRRIKDEFMMEATNTAIRKAEASVPFLHRDPPY